jgi:hypothetical protein
VDPVGLALQQVERVEPVEDRHVCHGPTLVLARACPAVSCR